MVYCVLCVREFQILSRRSTQHTALRKREKATSCFMLHAPKLRGHFSPPCRVCVERTVEFFKFLIAPSHPRSGSTSMSASKFKMSVICRLDHPLQHYLYSHLLDLPSSSFLEVMSRLVFFLLSLVLCRLSTSATTSHDKNAKFQASSISTGIITTVAAAKLWLQFYIHMALTLMLSEISTSPTQD